MTTISFLQDVHVFSPSIETKSFAFVSPCFSEIFLVHVGHLNIIALVYGHAFFESNSDK